MAQSRSSGRRAMRVFVAPGSHAERICRRYAGREPAPDAARRAVRPAHQVTEPEAIANGFQPQPELNLRDNGGKIIRDLVFTNFYVGGSGAWDQSDIKAIDENLAAAMSDVHLNNVIIQYFRNAAAITSTFRPSTILPGAAPDTISQQDLEAMIRSMHGAGNFGGFDTGSTVFNFMLPRGVVLTIGDPDGDIVLTTGDPEGDASKAGAARQKKGEVEDKASSLEGLGGFHGSVQTNGDTVYYAIGAFSEGNNGIVAFDQSWKNVVATFYHELNEARTDIDVETGAVAWVTDENPSEEIGDTPIRLAGNDLSLVFKEVPRADGRGTVPIQLMWSNFVAGPEGPSKKPRPATS
jgi:hypothetical protein